MKKTEVILSLCLSLFAINALHPEDSSSSITTVNQLIDQTNKVLEKIIKMNFSSTLPQLQLFL